MYTPIRGQNNTSANCTPHDEGQKTKMNIASIIEENYPNANNSEQTNLNQSEDNPDDCYLVNNGQEGGQSISMSENISRQADQAQAITTPN